MYQLSNIIMRRRRGFTLVELLIAIALFSILITVAVGGFTKALHTQSEISALIAAESNAGLAIEQITREIRTGTDFCAVDAVSGRSLCDCPAVDAFTGAPVCSNLAFVNAEGQTVMYYVNNGVLEKSVDGGSTFAPATGSDATVSYLTMTILDNTPGDYPRVTFSVGVSPNDPALASQVLNLQTTVSVRAKACDASGNC